MRSTAAFPLRCRMMLCLLLPCCLMLQLGTSSPLHAEEAAKYRDPVDRLAAPLQPSRQIVYKTVGNRELRLHIFEPEAFQTNDRRSAFVIIHGGGWTGGKPKRMYPFADHFARRGMVGISVEYRLLDPQAGTTVFDCVKDGRSAIRFVRANADRLGIDPEKIVVSGGSAGGHVAAGTALFSHVNAGTDSVRVSSVPNAMVLLFPVIDTSTEGYGNQKIGARWEELSPVHQVVAGLPPTLIFHGTADTVTPFAGAQAFCEAMHQAGNTCVLKPFPGGKHGYLMRDEQLYRNTLAETEAFLREHAFLP